MCLVRQRGKRFYCSEAKNHSRCSVNLPGTPYAGVQLPSFGRERVNIGAWPPQQLQRKRRRPYYGWLGNLTSWRTRKMRPVKPHPGCYQGTCLKRVVE
jgi:hypothetical protein